jgi:hypothetical protein
MVITMTVESPPDPSGPFFASQPVLTRSLLARQYELNLDYLDLVVAEHSWNRSSVRRLPDRVVDMLAGCSPEQRQRLASATYSLYSLGFEDQCFWQAALRSADASIEAKYGVLSSSVVEAAFCEVALMHAWHVSQTQPIAARVLYGMPAALVNRMNAVKLWQLKRIAADYPGLLIPRWPSNPYFWPDMIKFARSGDLGRLHAAQQLGRQLMAVELQESALPKSPLRLRQRNLLLQRLRSAKRIALR